MEYAKLQDKCRGSLVGGAICDALGYEVEFMSLSSSISIADDLCADIHIHEVNLRVGDRYVHHLPAEVAKQYLL